MPLTLPRSDSGFVLPPAGMHPAICYRLIDLGTQDEPSKFKTTDIARRLLISWELAIDETMEDGRPFTISRRYKYSGHEKSNLRKDLEAWRGRKFSDSDFGTFDISKVVGTKCMLNIQHAERDGSDYANIVGLSPPVKGVVFAPLVNKTQVLVLERGDFRPEVYDGLSDKLKELIAKSPEYIELKQSRNGSSGPAMAGRGADQLDDEIPF